MSDTTDQPPACDPEMLELFIEESLEGLHRMEELLIAAEKGETVPNLMTTLFRDIHTIKGTSAFLALNKILSLSHVAEDLLSRLRDQTLSATEAHFTHLMGVVDLLRLMIDHARAHGTEGEVEVEPMIALLRQDLLQHVQAEVVPLPPPPLPPEAPRPQKLGEILVDHDLITEKALTNALQVQQFPTPENAAKVRSDSDGTVRVNVAVLDRLMNLIGELVLARNQMVQIVRTSRDPNVSAQAACQRLNLVTTDLQEQIMKTRMQPVARVFDQIPRMLRDLCRTTGKQVVSVAEGVGTEIDKALVEAIRDPVMHIVRNAVDHGIECPQLRVAAGKPAIGKVSVRASHEGGMVTIEIEDDGAGMDPRKMRAHAVRKGILTAEAAAQLSDREALLLVMRPGFSTAEKVSDISGRGVGMDVVRTHVERAGGQVELDSVVGKGSVVRLKMPLTLAIIPALLVEAKGQRFAIPQVSLLELVYLNEQQVSTGIERVRGAAIYRLRGEILPLVHLSSVLGITPPNEELKGDAYIVVVAAGARRYGLVVDRIRDTEEIVIKPLHGQLKRLACYSGATVLGDGGVALILEVKGVAARAGIDTSQRTGAPSVAQDEAGAGPQSFIVFKAGDGAQCAVPLAMVARLEQLPTKNIERVAGAEVIQYRKAIMPVLRPESCLPLGDSPSPGAEQPFVVFDFGQMVGMAVSEIVDVVDIKLDEDAVENAAPFTMGQTVIFGKTTLILDVYQMVRQNTPQFVTERRKKTHRPRLLLVDDSNAMRAALGGYLRSCGIDVVDVASGGAALHELAPARSGSFDAVVTDLEMEGTDGYGVIAAAHRDRPALPVFVWTFHDDIAITERVMGAGAKACVNKLRREDLIEALKSQGIIGSRSANDDKRAA